MRFAAVIAIKKNITGDPIYNPEKRHPNQTFLTHADRARRINDDDLSVWMFPEGTRSRGRGLLPFKTGAFYAAIAAGVPIVPVVCSTTHNQIDLNRWDNGKVICEILPPVDTSGYSKDNVRELAEYCHQLMATRIAELDAEIAQGK